MEWVPRFWPTVIYSLGWSFIITPSLTLFQEYTHLPPLNSFFLSFVAAFQISSFLICLLSSSWIFGAQTVGGINYNLPTGPWGVPVAMAPPRLTLSCLCFSRYSFTSLWWYLLCFDSTVAFRIGPAITLDSWQSITRLLALPSFICLFIHPLMYSWTEHLLLFLPYFSIFI